MYFRHLFFTALFLGCAVIGPVVLLRASGNRSENYIYEMAKSFINEEFAVKNGSEIIYPDYVENYVKCLDDEQELKKLVELNLKSVVKSDSEELSEGSFADEFNGTIYKINSYFDLLDRSGRKQKHNYVCILTVNAGNVWTLLDLSYNKSSKSLASN